MFFEKALIFKFLFTLICSHVEAHGKKDNTSAFPHSFFILLLAIFLFIICCLMLFCSSGEESSIQDFLNRKFIIRKIR